MAAGWAVVPSFCQAPKPLKRVISMAKSVVLPTARTTADTAVIAHSPKAKKNI